MHIYWHGLSCVKLQVGDINVVINPFQNETGLSMPKLKVDIVATTNLDDPQTNNIDRLQGDPIIVQNAGEYEIHGVFFYGLQHKSGNTLFAIEAEGMRLGHLGSEPVELTSQELELFEGVDILFLPITGDQKLIAKLISHIEPRVIIPIQYASKGVKAKLDNLEGFSKEMGMKMPEPETKVIIKEKQLPAEETQVIVLAAA